MRGGRQPAKPDVARPLDGRVRAHSRAHLVLQFSMRTSFMRPDAPLLMDTADFGEANCLATSAMSSSLAFPSTGGALSRADHTPGASCTRTLTRAFGLTLTWITLTAPNVPSAGKHCARVPPPRLRGAE